MERGRWKEGARAKASNHPNCLLALLLLSALLSEGSFVTAAFKAQSPYY